MLRGDVRFENVDFGYTKEHMILKNISLYAKPGQKIAVYAYKVAQKLY